MKILFAMRIRQSKTLIRTPLIRPWFLKVVKLSEFKFFKEFQKIPLLNILKITSGSVLTPFLSGNHASVTV